METGRSAAPRQWSISEVADYIELPRRDIQRACYSGRGGASILNPPNSSWGKRSYSTEDVAKLFLVKRYKDEGYSLPEIREIFEREEALGHDLQKLLDIHIARMTEQLETLTHQLSCAESLRQDLETTEGHITD